jgi:hypothetical protein
LIFLTFLIFMLLFKTTKAVFRKQICVDEE